MTMLYFLSALLGILCTLLSIQIIRAELLFRLVRKIILRADSILSMVETHGRLTDTRADRIAGDVAEVKKKAHNAEVAAITAARETIKIPEKVVEKITTVIQNPPDSRDGGLPTVK